MRELRLVNKREVDETIAALRAESGIQRSQCAEVREAISSFLGGEAERRTFTSFSKHIQPIVLDKLIYATCDKAAEIYHTNYFNKQRDVKKILGLNIVDKLKEEAQGNIEKLKPQIESLVRSANTYMQLKKKVTYGDVMLPQERLIIFIPQASGDNQFRQELKQAFESVFSPEDKSSQIDFDENRNNPKEILLVSVWFFFELRCIQPLVFLQKEYENFLREMKSEGFISFI